MSKLTILALGWGLFSVPLPGAIAQAARPSPASTPQDADLCIPQPAEVAQTGFYRFAVGLITGDQIWVDPLPAGASLAHYWRVEKDSAGRVGHAVSYHWNDETLSLRYYYAGNATLPCRMEQYNQNRQLNEVDIPHRDAAGNIVRSDEEDATGKLTGYTITKYDRNQADDMEYAADGRPLQRNLYLYGTTGRATGRTIYPGGSAPASDFVLQEISEENGEVLRSQQFHADKQLFDTHYTYTPDGELTHADSYAADGQLDSTRDWVNGLVTNKTYPHRDGKRKELRYFFDNNRDPSTTDVYIDGQLLCTMKYSRKGPDQFATNVYGADGQLWAYYPPPLVTDMERDGEPVARHDGVIFKKGIWW